MTNERTDGGPAFPQTDLSNYNMGPEGIGDGMGMSLRDYFAGQALSIVYMRFVSSADPDPQDLADQAYMIADAMLAARVQS